MLELDRIYNMDCLEGMKQIPDNYIDLVITSPPYNLGIEYDVYNDKRDWVEYYNWCNNWLREIYRILKNDGRFCLNHYLSVGNGKKRYTPIMDLNWYAKQIGFNHHSIAIWNDTTVCKKTAWGSWKSASAPYINSPYEAVLIMYKDIWKKQSDGITEIGTKQFIDTCLGVWHIAPNKINGHPATFPIELADRCIRLFSYENDIVLDCFIGSGTVAIASKMANRKYIGFEISKRYCDMANKKLNNIPVRIDSYYDIQKKIEG